MIGRRRRDRGGSVAIEMVLLLPVFCYVCLIAIDFSRVFYAWAVLADCARNGAVYASDPSAFTSTPYATASQAALADASNLSPTPMVSSTSGTDGSGNSYVQVTVTYTFTTISNYPGIPSSMTLTRTLRMMVTP